MGLVKMQIAFRVSEARSGRASWWRGRQWWGPGSWVAVTHGQGVAGDAGASGGTLHDAWVAQGAGWGTQRGVRRGDQGVVWYLGMGVLARTVRAREVREVSVLTNGKGGAKKKEAQ